MTEDYSYYAILIAGLVPYVFTGFAKFGEGRSYDNHDPRAYLDKATGKHRRAHNAQLNSFESFPLFAAGVIVAHAHLSATPDYTTLNGLAWSYIVIRLIYGWLYITDRAVMRSVVWALGISVSMALFLI